MKLGAMNALLAFSIVFGAGGIPTAYAKRMLPPRVRPIAVPGAQYSVVRKVIHCGEDGVPGYSVSVDFQRAGEPQPVWHTTLLSRSYLCGMETDVQDIYVKSFEMRGEKLLATDERGIEYEIDAGSGKLLKPLKSVIYAKQKLPKNR